MRNAQTVVALLAAAVVAAGCDGSSGLASLRTPESEVPSEIAPLQGCMAGSVETLARTLGGLGGLAGDLQDPLNAVSLTPTGDPTVWFFELGELGGTATFSGDPTAGFAIGDTIAVAWDYEEGLSVFGSGQFTFELTGPTTVAMHGTGGFDDATTVCVLNVMVPANAPMMIDFAGLGTLAANLEGAELTGTVGAVVSEGDNQLTADFVFVEGDDRVRVENAIYNGSAVEGFWLPLPAAPRAGAWNGLWALSYDCSGPGGNFIGNATIEIEHAAGASTFSGVEREPGIELPFSGVSVSGDTATLTIEYDRGDGRLIREVQVFTLAPDGRSFTKTSTARYLDDNSIFVACTGTATKE